MKLIYGKSYCTLEYGVENIRNIVIKYRGNITIRHHHMEFLGKLNKHRGYFFNFGKKSLLIKSYNEIKIGYNEEIFGEVDLFRWIGEFKILSAKVNGKVIPVKVTNVDYWNFTDSKWDSAGKPEGYRGTYHFGRSPKMRRKISSRTSNRGGRILPTRTATSGSGGGY